MYIYSSQAFNKNTCMVFIFKLKCVINQLCAFNAAYVYALAVNLTEMKALSRNVLCFACPKHYINTKLCVILQRTVYKRQIFTGSLFFFLKKNGLSHRIPSRNLEDVLTVYCFSYTVAFIILFLKSVHSQATCDI